MSSDAQAWSRRALQFAVGVTGLVPVGAGLAGMLQGPWMVSTTLAGFADPTSLDSHFRYLSGLLLAIGLAFWSLIPNITTQGHAFRLLTLIVVTGGFGRLIALLLVGVPPPPMLFGLAMELVATPLLCLWQSRIDTS
jgi:Domain of unknown function (DUF4345)